jgi:hypothetical protein
MAYFKPDGLERSGKLVLALVQNFDREQPKEKTGHFMLVMVGEKPLFIKPVVLGIFIILSILVGIWTLVRARKKRVTLEEDKKIRLSWPKLLVLLVIIVVATMASQWTMQLLKGLRLPWITHPGPYFIFAFFFVLLGVWLALQVTRKWKLRKNTFFYLIRAEIYLTVLVFLAWSLGGSRLALYPAAGLLLISLACLAPWGWLKGLLWLLSPYLMFRLLILPEYYQFIFRTMGIFVFRALKTPSAFGLFIAGFMLFLVIWTMPFLLGLAAVYRSFPGDLFQLKAFRRPFSLLPLGVLVIGGAIYLLILPSYAPPWEQVVTVTQKWESEKNKTFIEFLSGDYLRGIEATVDGKPQTINLRSCVKEIEYALDMDWIKDKVVSQSEEKGAEKIVDLGIALEFSKQPFTVSLSLKSDKVMEIEESNVKFVANGRTGATITWFSFPQGSLEPKLKLRLPKDAKIEAELRATFLEKAVPISSEGKNKFFVYRTLITRKIWEHNT